MLTDCLTCRNMSCCDQQERWDDGCINYKMMPTKNQTNANGIRAMTDEELAELLEMIPHSGNPPTYTIDGFCIDDGLRTKRQWLDWLRQEATK